MPVTVRIPIPLRGLTNGQKSVEVEGKTVSEVLLDLETKYPGIREKLYDKETLRPFFSLFLNNEGIQVLNRDEGRYELSINNPVKDGDQISIIPPMAGGKAATDTLSFMMQEEKAKRTSSPITRRLGVGAP